LKHRIVIPALAVIAALLAGAVGQPVAVTAAQAATCASYSDQAAAQRAADTRDGDSDGVYCETLPCPCASGRADTPAPAPAAAGTRPAGRESSNPAGCVRTTGVQPIGFSSTRYPTIRAHFERAIARGWPRVLVLNRDGADARRDRLLRGFRTRSGHDRDEYPPAIGRGRGTYLRRGFNPIGWRAAVAYVPSGENRSHGATLGIKLRRFCNGTRFRYVFY
jgi:hypothetical protein